MDDSADTIGKKLAPFNPTHDEVIKMAINMFQLGEEDTLYDLGCGDGRLLVEAVRVSGACGVGVEYDKRFADRAIKRVCDADLTSKIRIIHGNVLDVESKDASAVFVYLVPEGLTAIRERLVSFLRAGVKVITYGLAPTKVELFKGTRLYLYTMASLESQAHANEV